MVEVEVLLLNYVNPLLPHVSRDNLSPARSLLSGLILLLIECLRIWFTGCPKMPTVEFYREKKKKTITTLVWPTHHIYPDADHVLSLNVVQTWQKLLQTVVPHWEETLRSLLSMLTT